MKIYLSACILFFVMVYGSESLPYHQISKSAKCNKPQVESLLLQTSFAKYIGRTRYIVCPKTSTKEERELSQYLKQLKSVGLPEYLARRQQCQKQHLPFSTETEKTSLTEEEEREDGEDLTHKFPAETEIVYHGCKSKGADDANNTVSMCTLCNYDIFLPESFYPRIHRHVTCHNNGDYSCLTGSGVCVMNNVDTPLLFDEFNVGHLRLSEWTKIEMRFTKSCSCQIIQNDSLQVLV